MYKCCVYLACEKADISRLHRWFPREMTCILMRRHYQDVDTVLLIGWRKFSTNQKHNLDQGGDACAGSGLVSETSFHGETSVGATICGLFFSFQCLLYILSELAAVYYTKKNLTEISLKGYLFVMFTWLMKLSIASSVVNQLVAPKVSSKWSYLASWLLETSVSAV